MRMFDATSEDLRRHPDRCKAALPPVARDPILLFGMAETATRQSLSPMSSSPLVCALVVAASSLGCSPVPAPKRDPVGVASNVGARARAPVSGDLCPDGTAVWIDDAGGACSGGRTLLVREGALAARCASEGRVLVETKRGIILFDARGREVRPLGAASDLARAVSPDAKTSAAPSIRDRHAFDLRDVSTGAIRQPIKTSLEHPVVDGWAAADKLVLRDGPRAETRSITDGALLGACSGCIGLIAVSPDGRSFVTSSISQAHVERDGARRSIGAPLQSATAEISSAVFSLDGSRLLVTAGSHAAAAVDDLDLVQLYDTSDWKRVPLARPEGRFSISPLGFLSPGPDLALLDERGGPWAEPGASARALVYDLQGQPIRTFALELDGHRPTTSPGALMEYSLRGAFSFLRLSDGSRTRFRDATCGGH